MKELNEIIKKGRVDSKKEYYTLYENNFFGNKPLTWNSVDEIKQSKWKGGICIRGKRGIARSRARFDLSFNETIDYIKQIGKEGVSEKDLTFNQSMPNEHLMIQGEIMRSLKNYSLTYTTVKEPMNYALAKETLYQEGINALLLVKRNLFDSSYGDLELLFDIFPDSIIEFSAYDICVGDLQNRNTIIWEVRNY
ncbi:MAG: hypothetical protein M1416_00915 [Candidatus Pacearchaeota archaeon]|nr:hypothetical protein [Candidatus Pacearchaeota archaeon]